MKNNLLLTTALVSAAFAFTANAWADEKATETVDKETTISGETYENYTKGAITNTSDLTIEGGSFNENSRDIMGAAILDSSPKGEKSPNLTTNGTDFKKNKSKQGGGAIAHRGSGRLSVNGGTFEENIAGNNGTDNAGNGGAIFVGQGSTLEVDGATFSGNEARGTASSNSYGGATPNGGAGGAISSEAQNATIKNATFTGNSADVAGGAINNLSEMTVEKSTFSGNTSNGLGGAIMNRGGKLTLTNADFSGNRAELGGGAIYTNKSDKENATITITGGSFTNNLGGYDKDGKATSTAHNGGAIFAGQGTTLTVTGTSFEGNKASGNGGAIAADNTSTFEDVTFANNTAGGEGGALFVSGNSGDKVTFSGKVAFEGNTDSKGANDINFGEDNGTITVADNATLSLDGGISCNGSSSCSSAKVEMDEGSTLNVHNDTKIATQVTGKSNGSTKFDINVKLEAGEDSFKLSDIFTHSGDATSLKDHVLKENGLFKYTEKDGTYTSEEKSAAEVASGLGVNGSEAETLLTMMRSESHSDAFAAVQDVLGSLAQDKEFDSEVLSKAADALVADAAPTVRVRETALSNMIFDTATDALDDSLQNAAVGQASGDSLLDKAKVWVKGLFNYADKDDTNKSHGFDIDTYGVAFGMDKNVSPSVKLGAGYAYSQSDIDGYTRDTDVDTHTLFAYAKYKPANWYVNTVASYSFSDYKEKKSVLSYSADAKYDVDTFGLQSVYGYELNTNGYDITPEAGLRYLHIAKEGYVDELGTMAVSKNTNVLTAIAGVKAAKTFELSNGMNIRPEVRAAVTYDLTSDNNDTRVVLPNGEALKVAGEKFDRFGAEFGAKVATDVTSQWEVAAGYEGRFRDDYSDHTGILSAKYKF